MAQQHVDVPLRPAEHQHTDGGGHQQLPRTGAQIRLACVARQIVPRADAADQKQHHHEPRIQQVQHHVQRLRPADRPHDASRGDRVEHVNDMVHHHQQHRQGAQVVQVILSHTKPTFAKIFNIL